MKTHSRLSAQFRPARTLPMPLWLQGVIELCITAFVSLAAVFVLLFAVWFAGGLENRDALSVAGLSGQIWQLIHGVPLHLDLPIHGAFDAISGTISLMPMGLTLIPLWLCFRSGRRLAQASYEGQFWVPTLAGTLTYALISLGLSFLTAGDYASTSPVAAALIPCWVVVLGMVGGGWYESRSLARMIGVNAAEWVTRFSQYSRWAGSYLWTIVQSSCVALLGFIAGGALLFSLTVFYHWSDVLVLYQSLHAGAVGDTAITLLQFGFIPNFVVWAMAWSTGAGFAFGEGTAANLQVTDVGALPALPILGALPVPVEPLSYLALLVPVSAGLLAGWWFFRAGENHFDEWLSLKIPFRWISWPLSTLALALQIGILAGIWTALIGWVAHGSLGLGRFTDIGPHPLYFGLLTSLWVALGTLVGSILAPLVEKDTSRELERFSSLNPAEEKARKKRIRAEKKAARSARRRSKKLPKPYIEGEVVGSAGTETGADQAGVRDADSPVAAKVNEAVQPSASVLALRRIFDDDAPQKIEVENLTDEASGESVQLPAPAPEPQTTPGSEEVETGQDSALPWGTPEAKTGAENTGQDNNSAEETSAPAEPDQPKLSRGRVIRRPKSRKKRG